ncbi:MAG: 23S rRNA (pseudouridine(1915)-N(3))-methyltransferase RlmH [Pseudohongiellaceae bacterium]|jgi:23S rRNA (pseudouridine1915-N3)-methyltransferase
MRLTLVSVGQRMPAWVEAGIVEYQKRLPREFELRLVEVPLAQRSKTVSLAQAVEREGEACLRAIPAGDFVVALDVLGKPLGTEALATRIGTLRDEGRDLCLLVGGPDGLAETCLRRADATWSLSLLTFPHPLVRLIVAEQVYRVWTLLKGHPYHRA